MRSKVLTGFGNMPSSQKRMGYWPIGRGIFWFHLPRTRSFQAWGVAFRRSSDYGIE
ncbi:MAG: hypothetical protein ACP5O7_02970 [Phycisphaerae bacterium]